MKMLLDEVWQLSYDEYVKILLEKYGPATCDYFVDGKVAASKAMSNGLECHHIDENIIQGLSTDFKAEQYPEYQKADRLVYCNRIEHLILHAKIAKMNNWYTNSGINILITRLNDGYTNNIDGYDWNSRVHFRVRYKKRLFIEVLRRIDDDLAELGYSASDRANILFSNSGNDPEDIVNIFITKFRIKKMEI